MGNKKHTQKDSDIKRKENKPNISSKIKNRAPQSDDDHDNNNDKQDDNDDIHYRKTYSTREKRFGT